jgi:hypothetical protein
MLPDHEIILPWRAGGSRKRWQWWRAKWSNPIKRVSDRNLVPNSSHKKLEHLSAFEKTGVITPRHLCYFVWIISFLGSFSDWPVWALLLGLTSGNRNLLQNGVKAKLSLRTLVQRLRSFEVSTLKWTPYFWMYVFLFVLLLLNHRVHIYTGRVHRSVCWW